MLKSFYTASPSLHPQSGAQVGFLKMSAEGVGSRVIRAKSFGLRPILLTTGLGSEKLDSHKMRSALFIWLAVNPENGFQGKVLEHTFYVFNFRSMGPGGLENCLRSKALRLCLEGSGICLIL